MQKEIYRSKRFRRPTRQTSPRMLSKLQTTGIAHSNTHTQAQSRLTHARTHSRKSREKSRWSIGSTRTHDMVSELMAYRDAAAISRDRWKAIKSIQVQSRFNARARPQTNSLAMGRCGAVWILRVQIWLADWGVRRVHSGRLISHDEVHQVRVLSGYIKNKLIFSIKTWIHFLVFRARIFFSNWLILICFFDTSNILRF